MDRTHTTDVSEVPPRDNTSETDDLRDDADDFEDQLIDEMRRKGVFVVQ